MRMYRTEYGASSKAPYEGAPYELRVERHGEVYTRPGIHVEFEVQDGLRTWSDGQQDVVRGHFSNVVASPELEGHDICLYCGADNGLRGEWREGWSCCYCGGN